MSYIRIIAKINSKLRDLRISLAFLGVSFLLAATCVWAYYEYLVTPLSSTRRNIPCAASTSPAITA